MSISANDSERAKCGLLVTGASGFVGGALVRQLAASRRWNIRAALRREVDDLPAEIVRVDGLAADTDWRACLEGIDIVVHAAARVHVMDETDADPLASFRRVNRDATLNLARQASAAGVRRFVYLSTIKVNGEFSLPGRPFHADDAPAPVDPYGVSKQEAEAGLRALAQTSGMEVVIIRPVLVYGPGVKANFLSMMRWLDKGIPLPFGAVNNRRSLVSLGNLNHFTELCLEHPGAANQTWLVSDGEDISTTGLLRKVGAKLGKRPRLVSLPSGWLIKAGYLLGQGPRMQRLFGSLQVDISKNAEQLGWVPPYRLDDELERTVKHYTEVYKA